MILHQRPAMISNTPLFALGLGLSLVIIGMITADPIRSGFASFLADQPTVSAFLLFLIGCLLMTVGACSLLEVSPFVG